MQSRPSQTGLSSISRFCAGAALFLAAVSVTAAWETKGLPGKSAAAAAMQSASAIDAVDLGPSISSAAEILAVRKFHHDKRQPRPPRHRSERASSFAAGVDLTAAVIHSITHDDSHRPLVAESTSANPLSGHPLEVLRPPSVCA